MSVKDYHAPWGRKVWLITGAVSLLGLGAAIAMPFLIPTRNAGERRALWIMPFVIPAIVGITSLWAIRRFELTDDTLIVRRVMWANQIPLAKIESAEIDAKACEGARKMMGNDGLFAMHGRFRSKRLGKFQAYVTDPANSIVLKVSGDIVVITPESPRSFVKELNRRRDRLKEKC